MAGVKFTTPALREVNDEHARLKREYEDIQKEIVEEVLRIVKGYCAPMEQLNDRLAVIDVIASFAHVSINAPVPYVRPKILPRGEGGIELTASRHPCVEVQDDVSFIPNDASLVHGTLHTSLHGVACMLSVLCLFCCCALSSRSMLMLKHAQK